ncbi:MAG TPA: hydroxymethylbilane synthase [bacterium]|nr:hydroxymethylbilane synthase [bacterium]
MADRLVIGTRGSALALWQAKHVQAALTEKIGAEVVLELIKTSGDKNTEQPLSEIGAAAGGKGLFVKEIEEALLAKKVDLAVHSSKDLPSVLAPGLVVAAFLTREDARDALLIRPGVLASGLSDLPRGAKVGTSSLRRAAQLLSLRPDLEILDLRGNVDTRVRKLEEGRYDAIVLAHAGLKRMGLAGHVTQLFDVKEMVPAVGQGAVAVEVRAGEPVEARIRAALDDAATRGALEAERGFLARLGAGCTLPVAAHARVRGSDVSIDGLISARPARGSAPAFVRAQKSGPVTGAAEVGKSLAEELLAKGGTKLLAAGA